MPQQERKSLCLTVSSARRSSGMPNKTLEFTCGHCHGPYMARARNSYYKIGPQQRQTVCTLQRDLSTHPSSRSRTLLGGTCVATSTWLSCHLDSWPTNRDQFKQTKPMIRSCLAASASAREWVSISAQLLERLIFSI